MFVRCTFFKIVPEKLEEVKQLYTNEVMPVVKQQAGNLDIRLLEPVDKSDDFISVSEWKTSADAEAYDRSGLYQQLVHKFEGLFTKTPVLKTYHATSVTAPAL